MKLQTFLTNIVQEEGITNIILDYKKLIEEYEESERQRNMRFNRLLNEYNNDIWYLTYSFSTDIDFIHEYQDKVDWKFLTYDYKSNVDFIREFQDKLEWKYLTYHHHDNLDFIREFQDKLEWKHLKYHHLDNIDFIREFQDKVLN
jgi:hypothetical protein